VPNELKGTLRRGAAARALQPAETGSHAGAAGELWRVGQIGRPIDTQVQAFYKAETRELGPDWQLRFRVPFFFPR